MDQWAARNLPFVFLVDFEQQKPLAVPLSHAAEEGILFATPYAQNAGTAPPPDSWFFEPQPISFEQYLNGYQLVAAHILRGNSFLLNFTCITPVVTNLSLRQIFLSAGAKYRVLFRDEFVCFSPETFIEITGNNIVTRPMKGTIDASLPDAHQRILNDFKESAEHNTIVDLLRNDLNRIARRVKVNKFRYTDLVQTHAKPLLQVSSEITGLLPSSWPSAFSSLLKNLLPAGSVSGAPKAKTLEIIRQAEQGPRGYYTGVFGLCRGRKVEVAVLIRYIEQRGKNMFYRSGGGITCYSNPQQEYQEMLDKVYLPFAAPQPNCSR